MATASKEQLLPTFHTPPRRKKPNTHEDIEHGSITHQEMVAVSRLIVILLPVLNYLNPANLFQTIRAGSEEEWHGWYRR